MLASSKLLRVLIILFGTGIVGVGIVAAASLSPTTFELNDKLVMKDSSNVAEKRDVQVIFTKNDDSGEIIKDYKLPDINFDKDGNFNLKINPSWAELPYLSQATVCISDHGSPDSNGWDNTDCARDRTNWYTSCDKLVKSFGLAARFGLTNGVSQNLKFYKMCNSSGEIVAVDKNGDTSKIGQKVSENSSIGLVGSSSNSSSTSTSTTSTDTATQNSNSTNLLQSFNDQIKSILTRLDTLEQAIKTANSSSSNQTNFADSDSQTLKLNNNILSIQNGNSVNLSDLNLLVGNSNLLQNAVSFDKLANCSANGQILKYYNLDPDGVGPLTAGWNCDNQLSGVDSQNLSFDNNTGVLSIDNANSVTLPTNLGVTGVNVSGSGNSQTLNLTRNGASTLSVSIPNTAVTYFAGAGISINSDTISLATGGIINSMLANNSIDSSKIADGSIVSADLASGSVATSKLADCSSQGQILKYYNSDPDGVGPLTAGWNCDADNGLTTETDGIIGNEVLNATAGGGLVRNGTGTASDPYTLAIATGGITGNMLSDGSITGTKIANNTITNTNLASNSIDSSKIIDGSIGNTDLATDSVNSSNIIDGSITWVDLGNNSVDTTKILDGSIGNTDLATDSVNSSNIIDGSVGLVDLVACSSVTSPGILVYHNTDPDGAGPLTVGWNCVSGFSNLPDNAVGNEVLNATAGGGLVRNGTGTASDPYTLAIATGGITGNMLSDGSITGTKIANNTITNTNLASNSIDSSKIIDGSIGNTDLATDSVNSSNIIDGSIGNADFADNSINSIKILDGSVSLIDLANDSVNSSKIVDGSVGLNDLAINSVDSNKIIDGSISNNDLAINSVNSSNIQNGSIQTNDLAACTGLAVGVEQGILVYYTIDPDGSGPLTLGWNCVDRNGTLPDDAIGNEVLDATSGGGLVRSGSGTTSDPYTLGIAVGGLSGNFIASNSIDSSKIVDGSVSNTDLAVDSVNSNKIIDGSITSSDLATNSINSSKIIDGSIAGSDIASETVTGFNIQDGSIDLLDLGDNSVNSTKILDFSIQTSDIATEAITKDKLANCSANGQILKYYNSDPDGVGPLTAGWNCDADNGLTMEGDGIIGNEVLNATTGGGLARNGTGTASDPYTLAIATGGITANMLGDGSITGAKIAPNSIDSSKIIDGSINFMDLSTDSVNSLKVQDGSIELNDLASNSVDSSKIIDSSIGLLDLNSNSIDSSKIIDGSITNDDLALNSVGSLNIIDGSISTADIGQKQVTNDKLADCSSQGQILKYYSSDPDGVGPLIIGWNCDTDSGLTSETDGIIGNEILNVGTSTGLVRNGTGTTFDPYTVDIKACGNNEVLKYNTTSSTWDCGADSGVGTETDGIIGNEILDVGTSTGLVRTGTGSSVNPFKVDLKTCTDTQILKYQLSTSSWVCSTDNGVGTEADGIIGNEVLNATTGGGLTRNGTGTNVDPYTLGIATGGITANMIGDGSITSAKIADGGIALVDLGSNSVDSSKIVDGSISLTDLASNSVDSSKIVDGSVSLVDLASNSVNSSKILDGSVSLADLSSNSVDSSKIIDNSITASDLAAQAVTTSKLADCSSQGQILKYYSSDPDGVGPLIIGWNCDTDSGLTSETDGIIGNEILNVGTSTGLVRNGTGTTFDPYTVDIKACGNNEVLKYNSITSNWTCGTDNNTTYSGGNGILIASGSIAINSPTCTGTTKLQWTGSAFICSPDLDTTSFNISANNETTQNISSGNTVNFNNGNGVNVSRSGNDLTFNLTNTAVTPGSNYNNVTVDAQGRITSASTVAYLSTETDGVIGNEVLNATTSGGLVRSGTGTNLDPYTLGIATGGITGNMLGDGSIVGAKIADGTIALADLSSNSVDSSKIIDNSITASDLAAQAVTTSKLADCSSQGQILKYYSSDPDGVGPLTIGWNCDTDSGLTSETDGIIGNEITNSTDASLQRSGSGTTVSPYTLALRYSPAGTASTATTTSGSGLETASGVSLLRGCNDGQLLKWNNTTKAWGCGADIDTNSGGTITSIAAGNGLSGGTITSSGTIAINSPTCTGTTKLQWTGTAFICSQDQDTIYTAGTGLALSGSTFNLTNTAVTPGSNYNNVTVDAQGRITSASTVAYLSTETDGVIGNEVLNATTSGGLVRSGTGTNLDPYTLGIATGGITGNMLGDGSIVGAKIALNSIDSSKIVDGSITLADLNGNSVDSTKILDGSISLLDVGNNSVDSNKIVDGSIIGSDIASGTITNANLVNSSLTIVSGSGLTNGGTVSLGGTTTLNIGAGNGISVNADDIAVKTTVATDGLSNTTSSGSGLEVLASGVTLLQGCNDGQILKWNESSDIWACNSDNGITNVGTLDSVAKSANGATVSGNNLILQTADATNAGLVSTGTQTFSGNKTFSGNVNNSGNTSLNTVDGAGLTSCNATSSKVQYNATTKQFACGTDSSTNSLTVRKTADESVALSLALQNDDHISLPVAANEKWAFNGYLNMTSGANIKAQMTLPSTGSTCLTQISETSTGAKDSSNNCNDSVTPSQSLNTNNGGSVLQFYGTFTVGATGGTAQFQWSQASVLATATTLKAGSYMVFTKITGADLAEIYYSKDDTVSAGDLVSLTGEGVSQVQKSEISKRENIIGIVSTKPGQVLAEDDGQGKPVPVALTGRVPVKVTDENGEIKAGDQITVSSSKPGYGAKAVTSGRVVGKALTDATPDGMVNVFVEPGYWQAPLNFDLSSIFVDGSEESQALQMNTSDSFVDSSNEIKDAIIKNLTQSKQYAGMDQNLVDQIQKGFKTQQDQIVDINKQISELKSSDSKILQQIGDQVKNGEDTTKATESVTGVKLVDGSGFEHIKSLEAIQTGSQIKVTQDGKAVDYNSVVGYLVQAVQDQQTQIDKLSKDDKTNLTDTNSTGLSLDLKSLQDSFLGQIADVKVRLDAIEKKNETQDKKLNTLEQENEDLKARLDKIEKGLAK